MKNEDNDLYNLSQEELIQEVKLLRNGIRKHRDSSLHDLCWHHPELWELLPEKLQPQILVPEWPQFLKGCIHYRQSLDEQSPDSERTSEEYNII